MSMTMKHIYFTSLLTILFSMVGSKAFAYDAEIDGIYYNFSGTEAIVTSRYNYSFNESAYSGSVIIPISVTSSGKTYNVTSIDEFAFYGCSSLTSITIPESVTSIGNMAFSHCSSLTSITIPNSVTSIGDYAFSRCSSLTSITIPNSVTNIGESAFNECYKVEGINIIISNPNVWSDQFDKLPFAPRHLYKDGEEVTSLVLPEGLTSIPHYSFRYCTSLTSITIPEGVKSIGDWAFHDCSNLTSITIPNSVTSIGSYAFYRTPWLENLPDGMVYAGKVAYQYKGTMPENTTIQIQEGTVGISDMAFYDCSNLTSIDIPESVTTIGKDAFYNCSGLTSIIIPEGVTSIGGAAFGACIGLTSITIPESVTRIGKDALWLCKGLTSIVVEEGNSVYDSRYGCNALIETASNTLIKGCVNTIIPEGVTSIGNSAFDGCTGLASITIPESVTSIGNGVFRNCTNLTSIIVEDGNSVYDSRNDCNALIETASNTLIKGCVNTIIPEGVTSIGNSAFDGCTGLTAINIPESVTSIGGRAFFGCNSLSIIKVGLKTPIEIPSDCFFGLNNTTLCVPQGCQAAYQKANIWNQFYPIIEANELEVTKTSILGGSTTMQIGLNNERDDFVAFQMDLTLPEGVGIDKTECKLSSRITDEEQVLTVGKLESGAYRLTSTSMSLKPFSGQNGTLFTLKLTATENFEGGQATINNILFSTSGSEKVTMSDVSFDIDVIYHLIYKVDGEIYQVDSIAYHAPLAHVDETPLITDVEQFSSPYTEVYEGSLEGLLDGDPYTFWHSTWHGGDVAPGTHYLQVEMTDPEELPELIKFEFKRRANADNDHTTEWRVMGTNNSDATKAECQELAYFKTPITKKGETLTSEPFNPRHYKYLRFYSEKQEGASYGSRGYFHIASFQLYPATISHPTPEKEGHTFAGWEGLPDTMPDHEVEVSAAFTVNSYALTYFIDDEEYLTDSVAYNTQPIYEAGPTKEGYTFAWDNWPETMPAHDVEVTGRFYLYGDVNTDEEVDVVDVVDIARFVVATPSDSFRERLADLNYDATVNIADAVTLVNHIAGDQNFVKAAQPIGTTYDYAQCQLLLQNAGQKALSFSLNGDADFTAFQFKVELPANTEISAMHINGLRNNGHQLIYNKVSDNRYRVVALSLSNAIFNGNKGELLNISIDGLTTDDVCIHDIHFVTINGTDVTFDSLYLSGNETGIADIDVTEGCTIYDLQGRRRNTLQRGLNIVGNKVYIKK